MLDVPDLAQLRRRTVLSSDCLRDAELREESSLSFADRHGRLGPKFFAWLSRLWYRSGRYHETWQCPLPLFFSIAHPPNSAELHQTTDFTEEIAGGVYTLASGKVSSPEKVSNDAE